MTDALLEALAEAERVHAANEVAYRASGKLLEGLREVTNITASNTLTLQEAAHLADRSEDTLKRWAARFGVGRKLGGRWSFDRHALVDLAHGKVHSG